MFLLRHLLALLTLLGTLTAGQEFEVRGTVQRLTPDKKRVVVAHEEIAGYMDAMTMEFTPANPADLAALTPGDAIIFRLLVTDRTSRIDRIRRTGGRAAVAPTPPPAAAPTPGAEVPDVALLDQTGRSFRLTDLRGRAVALTFIFTRCPLPDFCPLMNRNFLAVRDALAADPATNWRLLSVTIDPTHDTAEVLARYAKSYDVPVAQWTFATGALAEIQRLGTPFGLQFTGSGAQLTHNLRTVVIDPQGRVQRVFEGNRWDAKELAAELRRAMTSAAK